MTTPYDQGLRDGLEMAAKAADAEPEPAGPMPHCPPEWSVEDVARAAVRATRSAIARRIRALLPPQSEALPDVALVDEVRRLRVELAATQARETALRYALQWAVDNSHKAQGERGAGLPMMRAALAREPDDGALRALDAWAQSVRDAIAKGKQ